MKPALPALGGHESRAADGDHASLKLWLRLLACSTQIETEIRRRLRAQFGTTLPRFDYLAQLHRHPEGLRMNALSRCLMVTGGSITGLTDQLEKEGQVQREHAPDDRRAFLLRLTPAGRSAFERSRPRTWSNAVTRLSVAAVLDRDHRPLIAANRANSAIPPRSTARLIFTQL